LGENRVAHDHIEIAPGYDAGVDLPLHGDPPGALRPNLHLFQAIGLDVTAGDDSRRTTDRDGSQRGERDNETGEAGNAASSNRHGNELRAGC
jgi:hypothetical protein